MLEESPAESGYVLMTSSEPLIITMMTMLTRMMMIVQRMIRMMMVSEKGLSWVVEIY